MSMEIPMLKIIKKKWRKILAPILKWLSTVWTTSVPSLANLRESEPNGPSFSPGPPTSTCIARISQIIQQWQNLSLIDICYSFFAFLVPEMICFDTKMELLNGLEAKIMALIDNRWWPSLKSKMKGGPRLDYVAPRPEWKLWWWRTCRKILALLSAVSHVCSNLALTALTKRIRNNNWEALIRNNKK